MLRRDSLNNSLTLDEPAVVLHLPSAANAAMWYHTAASTTTRSTQRRRRALRRLSCPGLYVSSLAGGLAADYALLATTMGKDLSASHCYGKEWAFEGACDPTTDDDKMAAAGAGQMDTSSSKVTQGTDATEEDEDDCDELEDVPPVERPSSSMARRRSKDNETVAAATRDGTSADESGRGGGSRRGGPATAVRGSIFGWLHHATAGPKRLKDSAENTPESDAAASNGSCSSCNDDESQPCEEQRRQQERFVGELTSSVVRLKTELAQSRSDLDGASQRNHDLTERNASLRDSLDAAESERDRLAEELGLFRARLVKAHRALGRARGTVRDERREKVELRVRVERLREERDRARDRAGRCEAEKGRLRREKGRLEELCVDLRYQRGGLLRENKRLKSKAAEMEERLAEAEMELEGLRRAHEEQREGGQRQGPEQEQDQAPEGAPPEPEEALRDAQGGNEDMRQDPQGRRRAQSLDAADLPILVPLKDSDYGAAPVMRRRPAVRRSSSAQNLSFFTYLEHYEDCFHSMRKMEEEKRMLEEIAAEQERVRREKEENQKQGFWMSFAQPILKRRGSNDTVSKELENATTDVLDGSEFDAESIGGELGSFNDDPYAQVGHPAEDCDDDPYASASPSDPRPHGAPRSEAERRARPPHPPAGEGGGGDGVPAPARSRRKEESVGGGKGGRLSAG